MREVTVFGDGNHNSGATNFHDVKLSHARALPPDILDNCLTCPVREEYLFCNLPVQAVHKLNEIKSTAIYELRDAVVVI